ncbi:MAG: hypothetical protein Q7R70_04010 [Candidatus Diapherotrites archaeon]|nr:hypothetical protein [Candidatus Diapherotrites archaeon]
MDLSNYLRKGGVKTKYSITEKDRYCRQCNRLIEDKASYLYARGFCSEECNKKYTE